MVPVKLVWKRNMLEILPHKKCVLCYRGLGETEAILSFKANRSLCETFVSAVSPSPWDSEVQVKMFFADTELCTAHHTVQPGVCDLYLFFTKSLVHSILPSNSGVKERND